MMRIESETETGIVITYISEGRIEPIQFYRVPSQMYVERSPRQSSKVKKLNDAAVWAMETETPARRARLRISS